MGIFSNFLDSKLFKNPLLRKYTALVNEDLTATYSRDIQKWLLVAPIIGILAGLIITAIAVLVLDIIWAALLPYYLAHHWAIVVGLVGGFFVTGLIMQFCTPDPDEHSTEEIVRSYHEHQGDIDIGPTGARGRVREIENLITGERRPIEWGGVLLRIDQEQDPALLFRCLA